MRVGAQIRLHLPDRRGVSPRQAVIGARRALAAASVAAARHRVGQVGPEGGGVEAVDDGVAACVEVAEDKQDVVHVLGGVPDHGGLEPVPDPQKVVRGPADDEGTDDDDAHLEGLHAGSGNLVFAAPSQASLAI